MHPTTSAASHDSVNGDSTVWQLQREHTIASFLYRETDLLDAHQLEEWLALYTEDAHYWIPLDWVPRNEARDLMEYGTGAGVERVNIVYDDKPRLRDRVARMRSGAFWDETPPSRVVRMVTNVQVRGQYVDDEDRTHMVVDSKLLVRQIRQSRENTLAGQVVHDLIEVTEMSWQIYMKKISVVNAEKPLWNMTYVL